jgi:hypothetical protein
MRVYYRDDNVRITSSAVYVDECCYLLEQIESVWRRRRAFATRRVLIGLGVVAGAVLIRVVAGYLWWLGGLGRQVGRWLAGGPGTVLLVGIVGLGVAVLGVLLVEAALSAIEDIRGNGRHLELWARVDGLPIKLLHTTDSVRFGQVCRALVRARADLVDYPS